MGVKLGRYDSLDDFGMEFLGYSIGTPAPKLNTVSIPLRDGVIDMTEMLAGVVRFENREIKMRFEVMDNRWEWPLRLQQIHSAIHGQEIDVVLPDDTDHRWHGRCTVTAFTDNGSTGTLEISLDAFPFKYSVERRTFGPYTVSGAQDIDLTIDSDRAFFAFRITGTVAVTWDGDTLTLVDSLVADSNILLAVEIDSEVYLISSGVKAVPGLFASKGDLQLHVTGEGTIEIYLYEGWL